MSNEKITKLLDQVTQGLKADLEVRLDVTNELRAHLDDKIEGYQATGQSESESEETALKNFGDTIQIADGLIDANISRMNMKARLCKLAWILLVPAVLICAITPFMQAWDFNNIAKMRQIIKTSDPLSISVLDFGARWWKSYPKKENLILFGDRTRKKLSDQQKAIWERYPDNKMYLANYISILLSEGVKDSESQKQMLAELKKAEKLDPENALYNYLTAGILLKQACKLDSKRTSIKRKEGRFTKYNYTYTLKVKDAKLMDRAVQEYLKGTRKKHYQPYVLLLMEKRLSIMGPPQTLVENLNQISFAAGVLLPHLTYKISIAKSLWVYAAKLQQEGREKEALQIVKPWKTYLSQTSKGENCLMSVVTDLYVADLAEQQIPPIYRKAGMNKLSTRTANEINKITKVNNEWQKSRKSSYVKPLDLKRYAKSGVMAKLLLSGLEGNADYSEEEYAVSRKVEYCALETFALSILNMIFLVAIIISLFTFLYWRIKSKQKALLLAPKPELIGKAFLYGIAIPLAGYFFVSLLGEIGGHGYSLVMSITNVAAQFMILFILIPTIIFVLIEKYVTQRCVDLDIPIPPKKRSVQAKMMLAVCMIIYALIALFPAGMVGIPAIPGYLRANAIVLILPLIFIIVRYLTKYILSLMKEQKYALYYGALARSWVPILALAMIFMSITIRPYLNWRQASLIKQDKIIYGQPRSFTALEEKITKNLRNKLLEAIGEVDEQR